MKTSSNYYKIRDNKTSNDMCDLIKSVCNDGDCRNCMFPATYQITLVSNAIVEAVVAIEERKRKWGA